MKNDRVITIAGGNFLWILTLIFVIAKILGYINWSWWLVFMPLWLGLAVCITVFSFVTIIGFVIVALASQIDRR